MTDTIIKAENLGKKYTIGHQSAGGGYRTLRELLVQNTRDLWHKTRDLMQGKPVIQGDTFEEVWALRDVNFEIRKGEAVGIIGRNGAGKSTLLKILSRITEPTTGRVMLKGRVASLLEVGTGFHPELSGRENIYLNGAILGMTRAEITRKFDEIVAFAEVEKYLDTPVKRYSSGMYVRLAFAVAAHLEPEILVVDEVLAVGDAAFQKKCLGKMGDVANEGRTVLFVSHNMNAIQRLCGRAILLHNGQLAVSGETSEVIAEYLKATDQLLQRSNLVDLPANLRRGNGLARFTSIELLDVDGRFVHELQMGEPVIIRMTIVAKERIPNTIFGFSFITSDGVEIGGSVGHDGGLSGDLEAGSQTFCCVADPMVLTPGRYYLRAAIFRLGESFDHIDEALAFDVIPASTNLAAAPHGHYVGHIYIPWKWSQLDSSEALDVVHTLEPSRN